MAATRYKVGDKVLVESKIVQIDSDHTCKVQVDNGNYHWVTTDNIHPYSSHGDMLSDDKKEGMKEAWEIARRVVFSEDNGGFTTKELLAIFGTDFIDDIFKMPISEVAEKIIAWDKAKREIRVGDVVIWGSRKVLVTYVNGTMINAVFEDGYQIYTSAKAVTKTDGHIDIESLFKEIGGKP